MTAVFFGSRVELSRFQHDTFLVSARPRCVFASDRSGCFEPRRDLGAELHVKQVLRTFAATTCQMSTGGWVGGVLFE